MPSATILNKLAQVRRRERLLRFVWGVARVLAVALVLLAFCCLTDWLIDRFNDTPPWLLALLLLIQMCVAAALAVLFVVRPTFRSLSDSTVALWIERAFPAFRHRLVTAVELNRPTAEVKGMSPVLIAAVTKEAEQKAAATNFGPAVDSRRLGWSAAVLGPVLLLLLLLVLLAPLTASELLARQLLMPVSITRSVRFELQDVTSLPPEGTVDRDEPRAPHTNPDEPAICASGDGVAIRFKAEGKVTHETRGLLRIHPEGGAAEYHDLVWENTSPTGQEIFVAKVPPSSVPFSYKAWLGDARLHYLGAVQFEQRPTVDSQKIAVLLPEYCGLRSDGKRYVDTTRPDTKGEIIGMSGSTAIVTITASKPLKKAVIELLGPSQPGAPEQLLGEPIPMTLADDGRSAQGQFDLNAQQTAYRLVVWDKFGFANHVLPRRGIAMLPDEPPLVTLLPEDSETEGAPIVYGNRLLVGYRARSPVGLSSARFRYRIIRELGESTKDFQTLPLTEYVGSAEVGEFDLNRGVFEKIRDEDYQARVEFHAMPAPQGQQDVVPGRLQGGGRLIFETAKLPGLKPGDHLEFYVEVLDKRPSPLVGQSEVRIRDVVTKDQFRDWVTQKLREDQRLSDLAARQRSVFEGNATPPEK